jgi:hypothetical protein
MDPYRILHVRRDATPLEIQNAYKRLALWHHPARHGKQQMKNASVFCILAACYETLIDKDARQRCDVLLNAQHHGDEDDISPTHTDDSGLFPGQNAKANVSSTSSSMSQHEDDSVQSGTLQHQQQAIETYSVSNHCLCAPENSTIETNEPNNNLFKALFFCAPSVAQATFEEDQQCKSGIAGGPLEPSSHILTPNANASDAISKDAKHSNMKQDTKRHFRGPLHTLYRARNWQPFSDPVQVFAEVFDTDAWTPKNPSTTAAVVVWKKNDADLLPMQQPNANSWAGSTVRQPDGSVVLTTTRQWHNRRLRRTEVVRAVAGKRHSHVTVTSESADRDEQRQEEQAAARCIVPRGREMCCSRRQQDHDDREEFVATNWSFCGSLF